MRKTIFFLITALFLFAGTTTILTSCDSNEKTEQHENKEFTANDVFSCPMKCEGDKTYDKADKCPVCNMDLTKTKGKHPEHNH